jgi:outer membrane protein OmpA-like peptidoglycan-associated protein
MPPRGENASRDLASSFTDLMTSLAVIFILLLVAAVSIEQKALKIKQQELDQEVNGTQNRRQNLAKQLKKAFPDLKIMEDPNDPLGVLIIPPGKLQGFQFGSSNLPPGAADYLESLAPRLAKVVCDPEVKKELSIVTVEGHADTIGKDAPNLRVSAGRSLQVVETSLNAVDSPSSSVSLTDQVCFAKLLTASGRGRSDPIMDNKSGREDREASRRVIFKVRIKSVEERNSLVTADRESAAVIHVSTANLNGTTQH